MRIDGGEPEGLVTTAEQLDCNASLVLLTKAIGDYLETTYPGWLWMVQPDERGGVISLRSSRLHKTWGWVMRIAELQNDPHLSLAREAAGNILERFGCPRTSFWRAQGEYHALPRDVDGQCIPDIHDKPARVQAGSRQEAIRRAVASGAARIIEHQGRRIAVVMRKDIA